MKRWLMLLIAVFGLTIGACATDPGDDAWPDENEIRNNANKSHGDLRKEERKH
jgi:hypothetical protein